MRKPPKRYGKKSKIIMDGSPEQPGYSWTYTNYLGQTFTLRRQGAGGSGPTTLRQLKWSLVLGALFWAWWLTAGKDVGLDVFVRRQVHDAFGPTSGKRLDE